MFRIASQSKAITSAALLSLVEQGAVAVADPVSRYIPSFAHTTVATRTDTGVAIVPALQAAGAQIRAFDPEGMAEAKKLMADIEYCGNSYETMAGADALVLVTEWNEFRALDLARVKSLLKTPTIIDLRNIYKPADMAAAGFFYTSVGRATPAASPAALRNLA